MDYSAYLLSDKWKAVRAWAMQRANSQCQGHIPPFHPLLGGFRCTNKRKLQVHHLTYKRLGAELPEDVVVLCERCHVIEHMRKLKCCRCENDVYPTLAKAMEVFAELGSRVLGERLCRGCEGRFKE